MKRRNKKDRFLGIQKKIVILSNHPVLTYKFRKEVIQALVKAGYKVILVLPYGEEVEKMKAWGCEYIDTPGLVRHSANVIKEISLIGTYWKILRKTKPDLVLAYTIKPNLYGGFVSAVLGIPFMASITGLGMAIENQGILQKIIKTLYSVCLRKASCIFVQNERIKKFLQERKLKSRLVLVPGSGVNLEQHCYEEYPENDNEIIFVTLGRLMKDKGIDEILTAAKEIRKDYQNVRFQLIGFDDGNYKEIVQKAVKDKIVEYPGFQDDIHRWLANSHAILHASYHEGMANVLLEAAATGRPIIATDIAGCRETFEEGISGIGFKAQDAAELERAVREFIELPHHKKVEMGKAGRQKMEEEFDRKKVVDIYLNEIKELIG